MNQERWLCILVCIVVAYLYAAYLDLSGKKQLGIKKYMAITLCLGIAVVATWMGTLQSIVGGPMIGLFIGMFIVNVIPKPSAEFKEGTTVAAKKYLNLGIVMVGATLNYAAILSAAKALPMLLINLGVSFGVAYLAGTKLLSLEKNVCTLVGGGTSICGGSAIATLASIIRAKEKEIAYAMTAIFLFDMIAGLTYPYFADLVGLTPSQFGYLAGAAVNDTSSVVAAQSTYMALHPELGEFSLAITVKLVRTTLLLLVAVIFSVSEIYHEASGMGNSENKSSIGATIKRIFPWFILVFLGMALLNTLGLFDSLAFAKPLFKNGNKFLMTAALAGVGFKLSFKDLFKNGMRPIALGGITWFAVFASSLFFVVVFSNYIG